MLNAVLTPPRDLIANIIEQRRQLLLKRVPLVDHVAYLSAAELKDVQKWWKECTGEEAVTFLLGCKLQVKP